MVPKRAGHHLLYLSIVTKKKKEIQSTWVAQSAKRGTLDFSLGHDLRVVGSCSGLSGESAGLSPSVLHPKPRALAL